jgi:hypothetical protein
MTLLSRKAPSWLGGWSVITIVLNSWGSTALVMVVQRRGEIREERVRVGSGQCAVDSDGILDNGQSLFIPPQAR